MDADDAADAEIPLTGGNVGEGVVRVGDTVRRPAGFWSASVDALLRHLEEVGFRGAPRSLGFDERGRHVVEYLDGTTPMSIKPSDGLDALRRVGRLVREFHDASATFTPPAGARWNVVIQPDAEDLVIHHDLGPWNLVCGPTRWAFIDWDNAGPGSRLWDLAYAALGFVPLDPGIPVDSAVVRLAALVDGYGLDEAGCHDLLGLLARRALSMYDLLERGHTSRVQPWAQLWSQGHGTVWRSKAEYAERHLAALRAELARSSRR